MSIAETLLPRLAEWEPLKPGRQTLTVADGGWQVDVQIDRRDEFSCLTWEVALRRSGEPLSAALADRAARLATTTTGLLEALRVIEVDTDSREALLRSTEPMVRGDVLSYYEARVTAAGDASLRRFQASRHPGNRREQTAFVLTHEALANVIRSLSQD